MELHGYLEHGYRVLSHPEGKATPEILEQAEHVALAGLNHDVVVDLKLAGNKEDELYRLLLTAQCNALYAAMPFLFERIDDETELLLPSNLLNSDSLVRKLVGEIDEQDWQQVEIIGWLYQFYISEKKDEVIGKVVASGDIPAATQLFTPNWIVKYLTQNTLGRQWLATYPQSTLRKQMEFYIEPAEQTPEVLDQLKAITPTSLNPEELTLLDPACGSGHILVEAYELFKAIYEERGYRAKDIPGLILQKNLFGLEIDDRAAQLASFALMMKARADDRRIFESQIKPNVMAFEDSQDMDASDIADALNAPINKDDVPSSYLFEEMQEEKDGLFSRAALAEKGHVSQHDISSLLKVFEHAKTFGSLIQMPATLASKLPQIERRLQDVLKHGDLRHVSAHLVAPLLRQARMLARHYDTVVANPPYMGYRYFNPLLKAYANDCYAAGKGDLYGIFMERNLQLAAPSGFVGMITIPNWMFLPTFEPLRQYLTDSALISNLVHNGRGVFGSDFGSCAFVLRKFLSDSYVGSYKRLFEKAGLVASNEELAQRFFSSKVYQSSNEVFKSLPSRPIGYWITEKVRQTFATCQSFGDVAAPRQGLATSDNERFLRCWYEVSFQKIGFGLLNADEALKRGSRWIPYSKGGEFRRWYGNNYLVIDWDNGGKAVYAYAAELYGSPTRTIKNSKYYFLSAITWSLTSNSQLGFAARYRPAGFIFDINGMSAFPPADWWHFLAILNSTVANEALKVINPTLAFQAGDIAKIPVIPPGDCRECKPIVEMCVSISKRDWDNAETSWDFQLSPLLSFGGATLQIGFETWAGECESRGKELHNLEQKLDDLLLRAYGLEVEFQSGVSDDQITLYRPDRSDDIKRLLSYVIGCTLGRYSLDQPGLIYADGRNEKFDPSRYKRFRADDDGIVPLFDTDWGIRDDAASRIVEFVGVTWPKEHLEENLKFMADSLGPVNDEQPRETIRRYLTTGFFRHHLSMYKRRPIYWLFSSGKQRAFQCLVYLHRYHEGTLARMRTEYVIPLQGQIAARIEQLEADKAKATSTSHRNRLQKEQTELKKQQAELLIFEEKLKHFADQKITLDLDDGVKVNYAKFGDLLAESKAITGGKDDD